MMLLRCFDEYNLFGRFGDDGLVSTEALEGPNRPAVVGVYSTLPTGQTLALFRQEGRLHLMSGAQRWSQDDIAAVRHAESDDGQRLEIEHRHGVEVVVYPRPEPVVALASDPTPFVSSEDNDFGLFLAGVLNDSERADRIFRVAARPEDVLSLGYAEAIDFVGSVPWEERASGPDREETILTLRQLLRHGDTAVVAAAGRRILEGGAIDLLAQLLDVVARASDETQDVLLNAMIDFWQGATGPMPAALAAAGDSSRSESPPKAAEGFAIVSEAFGFTKNGGGATSSERSPSSNIGPTDDELPVYSVRGDGEYFDNDVANRWPERHWGYWGVVMTRMGLPVAKESDRFFRSDSSSSQLREEVADYLDGSPHAVVGQQPDSPCYLCDRSFNMAAHRSDGEWLWPANMGHLVRDHGFVVPNEMVDHIRAVGTPPDRLEIAIEDLPWPKT